MNTRNSRCTTQRNPITPGSVWKLRKGNSTAQVIKQNGAVVWFKPLWESGNPEWITPIDVWKTYYEQVD